MTSLWRHLWPNYDTLDFKILTQRVKMLGERVLQVWRWYLHRFRRYRKKTRGGGARNSPPSGARVKAACRTKRGPSQNFRTLFLSFSDPFSSGVGSLMLLGALKHVLGPLRSKMGPLNLIFFYLWFVLFSRFLILGPSPKKWTKSDEFSIFGRGIPWGGPMKVGHTFEKSWLRHCVCGLKFEQTSVW